MTYLKTSKPCPMMKFWPWWKKLFAFYAMLLILYPRCAAPKFFMRSTRAKFPWLKLRIRIPVLRCLARISINWLSNGLISHATYKRTRLLANYPPKITRGEILILTRITCMQQPIAHIFQTLI